MHRNGCHPTIGMPELLVRPALANLSEPQALKPRDDLARFQDRNRSHVLCDANRLRPDELGLEGLLPVLEQHGDDFLEIRLELVERITLAVSARKARDRADVDAGFRIAFDDGRIGAHDEPPEDVGVEIYDDASVRSNAQVQLV